MKFLFIVQGEGRGHFTQAITLEEMLLKNGHQVVEVLVGESSSRTLPRYFNRTIHAPVKRFVSPNFLPSAQNKRVKLGRSIIYNVWRLPTYIKSMLYIHNRIKETHADAVINFYELLTGLTYAFLRPAVPYICIGHQYLFLHPDFEFPDKDEVSLLMLRFFTRLTSLRCRRRLALSFRKMKDNEKNRVTVVPPLLRSEVRTLEPKKGDYIHGYMINDGFSEDVLGYHFRRPETKLHFFWDKKGTNEEVKITQNLTFHQINDVKFLKFMTDCRAFASTAGFESICEAMYLGKPVLMVPAHIEQDCNAFDAMKAGAGIISDNFDLDRLDEFTENYTPDSRFVHWVKSSEKVILHELEERMTSSSLLLFTSLSNYFNYEAE